MKKLIAVVLLCVCVIELPLNGCAGFSRSSKPAQRWYTYEYELRNSNVKDSLACEYENFAASFSVDESTLSVKIRNIGKESIYPHFDRAMVGIGNHYFPAAFSEGMLYPSASLTIPSKGYVEMRLAPLRAPRDGKLVPLYRTTDNGDSLVRREILGQAAAPLTLLLPLTVNGQEREYSFALRIKRMRSSPVPGAMAHSDKLPLKASGSSIVPLILVGAGVTGVLLLMQGAKTKESE